MNPVSAIAGVLSMCGIASVRSFMPLFVFCFAVRFLPQFDFCPPLVASWAQNVPSWMTTPFALCVFGFFAIVELAANWHTTARMLMEESGWDLYVKPVFAFLMCFVLVDPDQRQVAQHVLGGESVSYGETHDLYSYVWPAVSSTLGSAWTYVLCRIRMQIASALRSIDPENDFGVHYLAALAEESLWILVFAVLLLVPAVAAVAVAVFSAFAFLFRKVLCRLAEKRRRKWEGMERKDIVRVLDKRFFIVFGIGLLASFVPVLGFVLTVVGLKVFVLGEFALFENRWRRVKGMIFLRIMKLSALICATLLSCVPFAGIVMLLPYLAIYLKKRKSFLLEDV